MAVRDIYHHELQQSKVVRKCFHKIIHSEAQFKRVSLAGLFLQASRECRHKLTEADLHELW